MYIPYSFFNKQMLQIFGVAKINIVFMAVLTDVTRDTCYGYWL